MESSTFRNRVPVNLLAQTVDRQAVFISAKSLTCLSLHRRVVVVRTQLYFPDSAD